MSPLNFILVLCSVTAVYGQINGRQVVHVPRPVYDIVTKASADCVKETGVSQELADDFFNVIVSPNMETKTFMYCFGRKSNYVDEDGLIKDIFINLFNGVERIEEVLNVFEKCNIKKKSKYDTVFESIDCFFKNSPVLPAL